MKEYKNINEVAGGNVAELLAQAQQFLGVRNFEAAGRVCQKIVAADPVNTDAFHLAGVAAIELRRFGDAVNAFKKVVELRPQSVDARNNLALSYAKNKEYDNAIAVYNESLALHSDHAITYFDLANVLVESGDVDTAINMYKQAIAKNPTHFLSYVNLGNALNSAGNHGEALRIYKKALKIQPGHDGLYANIGNVCLAQGQLDQALKYYQKATSINPNEADYYYNTGRVFTSQKDHDSALQWYDKALWKDPDHVVSLIAGGSAAFLSHKYAESVGYYEAALRLSPENAEIMSRLGTSYNKAGKADKAIELLQNAISRNKTDTRSYSALMSIFLKQRRLEEAKALVEDGLCLNPEDAMMSNCVARFYQDVGEEEIAEKYYAAAIKQYLHAEYEPKDIVKRNFNLPFAQEAFLAFCKLMKDNGVEAFACFGTLLGFIRNGNFLSFDKDVDIGIKDPARIPEVIDIVNKSEDFAVTHEHWVSQGSHLLCVEYRDVFGMDIFFHEEDEVSSVAGFSRRTTGVRWKFTKFDLVPFEIFDTTVLIPENADRYLSEIYGEWQIPDPYFDSVVSGKNLVEPYNALVKCYTYNRLFANMHNLNKHKKAIGYCRKIRECEPDNDFIDDVEAFLHKHKTTKTRKAVKK